MLQRFFGIHPGERKNIFLFALLGFCWSIASSSGIALADALFLKHVGSHALAFTFSMTAIGMFCLSGIFLYLYNRLDIDQIFFITLCLAIVFFTTIFTLILMGVQSTPLWVIFKIFSYFFQIAFLSQFFTFLDQFFELQNAKSVFSLLYSPIFLGMAVSGAILSLSFTSVGILGMLILILLSLIASVALLKWMTRSVAKIPDDHQEFAVVKTSKKVLFKGIISSPFTLVFLLASVVLQSLFVITEFQYMTGLEATFLKEDPTSLTRFLGKLYFWGSLFNILCGVFLYGRLVKKIGLNNMILVVPISFLALFTSWFYSSQIFLPILGFMAVEGVGSLLEDNNFNLLLNAVPLKLKNKIRITCESLLEPIGMLLSSFLLMAFQQHSKLLGISLSILFFMLVCLMRAYYTKGIFYNLISHLIPFQESKSDLKSKVSKRDYQESRSKLLPRFFEMKLKEQLFLIESALRFNDMKSFERLLKQAAPLSLALKLNILELLENYPSEITLKFRPCFTAWIKETPSLENDFFLHLSKMKLLDIEIAQTQIHHLCPKIRGACLLTLRQKKPHSFESKIARKTLYELLISLNEEDNLIAIQLLKYEPLKDFKSKVFDLLNSSTPRLKEAILKTLPYLLEPHDSQYAPFLLKSLQSEEYSSFRLLVLKVLEKIVDVFQIKELLIRSYSFNHQERRALYKLIQNLGPDAISALESLFQNKHMPDRIRLMAAQILGKISPKQLKINFYKVIEEELERAYFYLYHSKTIQKSFPFVNSSLLTLALKNSFDSVFSFIIETLALVNRFDLGEHLVKSLHSANRKTYSHALETLDKMCSNTLYRKIKPLIEKDQAKSFLKLYHRERLPILTLDNLLDMLEQTPSYINQMIVPLFRDRFNMPSILKKEILSSSQKLDHFTLELLEVTSP